MFYVLLFVGIAILLVVAYFVSKAVSAGAESPPRAPPAPHAPPRAVRRQERKRRRAQSTQIGASALRPSSLPRGRTARRSCDGGRQVG